MTYKINSNCLLFTFFTISLLLLQPALAQKRKETGEWLKENIKNLGGRAVLIVAKEGKIVYDTVLNDRGGLRKNISRRKGISAWNENTVLPVASASKWLSAALLMTFVDEGKLRLSDTVGTFLPVLSKNGKGSITIAHCLSHFTGTGSLISENRDYINMSSMDECITHIAHKPLLSTPGTAFYYGSDGLQIAAAIVEKITGSSFESIFQSRIAGPLNMTGTTFGRNRVALAAGGARSTAADYMKFLEMLQNNGIVNGHRILSAKAIKEMKVNRTDGKQILYSPDETGTWGYGFGEWVVNDHTFSSPGLYGTFPWINTEEKYSAILFTYNFNFRGRHDRYRELIKIVDELAASK